MIGEMIIFGLGVVWGEFCLELVFILVFGCFRFCFFIFYSVIFKFILFFLVDIF